MVISFADTFTDRIGQETWQGFLDKCELNDDYHPAELYDFDAGHLQGKPAPTGRTAFFFCFGPEDPQHSSVGRRDAFEKQLGSA
jgi:hypothetical protein